MKASFVIPTFKEPKQIEKLISSFLFVLSSEIEILIINGNPKDETSLLLSACKDKRIVELEGSPVLYWSGLVNIGLNYLLQSDEKPEFVFILNADVFFDCDILERFLEKAKTLEKFQFAGITTSKGKIIASGAKVKSWLLTNIRHPLAGSLIENLTEDILIPVDYLPTRCLMFPFSALLECGVIAEKRLPHYGGDEEFTNRLRLYGYQPFIYTGVKVFLDARNTGTDVFHKRINLRKRIGSLFSIKSTANPIYCIRFVKMAYPWYAIPSGIILYVSRSILQVLFGGSLLKKVARKNETGFSGS